MKASSKQTVMKMREAYDKSIRKSSTENLKNKFPHKQEIEDASSTWISRKDIEELLNANNADGLRVYYGCHHESTHNDPAHDLHGLHNLIFVATKDSKDPKNPSPQTSIDQLNDTIEAGTENEEIPKLKGAALTSGMLCPPWCPTKPSK